MPRATSLALVTEGDFLRRGEIGTQRKRPKWLEFLIGRGRLASEYVHAAGRRVDEVMTADPVIVSEDDTLEAVVELMERRRIKRLPVMLRSPSLRRLRAVKCGTSLESRRG
jgi:CBS domain-containing protein